MWGQNSFNFFPLVTSASWRSPKIPIYKMLSLIISQLKQNFPISYKNSSGAYWRLLHPPSLFQFYQKEKRPLSPKWPLKLEQILSLNFSGCPIVVENIESEF